MGSTSYVRIQRDEGWSSERKREGYEGEGWGSSKMRSTVNMYEIYFPFHIFTQISTQVR